MVKNKKEFKWWYLPIMIVVIYVIWISMALADLDGNPFGVNNGKIKTYLSVINEIGDNAEQLVEIYKVGGSYEFVMEIIEGDFASLDEYESELERYGVGDRRDVVWELKIARLQLESARSQIIQLATG